MVAASNGEGVKANLTAASTAGNGRRGRRGEEEGVSWLRGSLLSARECGGKKGSLVSHSVGAGSGEKRFARGGEKLG